MARFEKDFRELSRHIDSLFAGQVKVNVDNIFDRSLSMDFERKGPSFFLEISPHEGPYAFGSFLFCIMSSETIPYPENAPMVLCLTRLYHPNIDTTCGVPSTNICVSTLASWSEESQQTLEYLVQSLIFLFYAPNIEDPLTSNVTCDECSFIINVRKSIRGGLIEDFDEEPFEMNYGYRRHLIHLWKQQTDVAEFNEAFTNLSLEEMKDEDVPDNSILEELSEIFENTILFQITLNKSSCQS